TNAPGAPGAPPQPLRQHLDGDVTIEPYIAGAIDLSHPTRPKRRDDLIVRQFHAGLQTHLSHSSWAHTVVDPTWLFYQSLQILWLHVEIADSRSTRLCRETVSRRAK